MGEAQDQQGYIHSLTVSAGHETPYRKASSPRTVSQVQASHLPAKAVKSATKRQGTST